MKGSWKRFFAFKRKGCFLQLHTSCFECAKCFSCLRFGVRGVKADLRPRERVKVRKRRIHDYIWQLLWAKLTWFEAKKQEEWGKVASKGCFTKLAITEFLSFKLSLLSRNFLPYCSHVTCKVNVRHKWNTHWKSITHVEQTNRLDWKVSGEKVDSTLGWPLSLLPLLQVLF